MERPLARLAPYLLVLAGMALFLGVRVQLLADDVPNPDIAGILYNADLILDGGLPYRDTAEIKPPGAFALTALSFATLGRGLMQLQWFHMLWLLLGAPAIWIAAAASDRERRWEPAIATATYLLYVGAFTYNYSSWMITPYAWAFAAVVRSLARGQWTWALAGGACAAWATLTIQRAAVIGPLAVALWILARRRAPASAKTSVLVCWALGAIAGAVPAIAVYAIHGETLTLVDAVIPWRTASDYASAALSQGAWGTLQAATQQLFSVFGIGLLLVGAAAVARIDAGRHEARPTAAWLFLLASVAGASLGGGRFYLHYLVQYVPALALMAGDPALVKAARRAFDRRAPRRAFAAVPVVLAAAALGWACADVARGRGGRYEGSPRRDGAGRTAAQIAGAHIAARSQPSDRLFVWGWSGWPTYYWADRRSPGRVYKPLGTLTTFNSNTAFRLGRPVHFRRGAAASTFIEEFDRSPPAYVVVSRSSVGPTADPMLEFTALEQRLQRGYRVERSVDDLVILHRVAK